MNFRLTNLIALLFFSPALFANENLCKEWAEIADPYPRNAADFLGRAGYVHAFHNVSGRFLKQKEAHSARQIEAEYEVFRHLMKKLFVGGYRESPELLAKIKSNKYFFGFHWTAVILRWPLVVAPAWGFLRRLKISCTGIETAPGLRLFYQDSFGAGLKLMIGSVARAFASPITMALSISKSAAVWGVKRIIPAKFWHKSAKVEAKQNLDDKQIMDAEYRRIVEHVRLAPDIPIPPIEPKVREAFKRRDQLWRYEEILESFSNKPASKSRLAKTRRVIGRTLVGIRNITFMLFFVAATSEFFRNVSRPDTRIAARNVANRKADLKPGKGEFAILTRSGSGETAIWLGSHIWYVQGGKLRRSSYSEFIETNELKRYMLGESSPESSKLKSLVELAQVTKDLNYKRFKMKNDASYTELKKNLVRFTNRHVTDYVNTNGNGNMVAAFLRDSGSLGVYGSRFYGNQLPGLSNLELSLRSFAGELKVVKEYTIEYTDKPGMGRALLRFYVDAAKIELLSVAYLVPIAENVYRGDKSHQQIAAELKNLDRRLELEARRLHEKTNIKYQTLQVHLDKAKNGSSAAVRRRHLLLLKLANVEQVVEKLKRDYEQASGGAAKSGFEVIKIKALLEMYKEVLTEMNSLNKK